MISSNVNQTKYKLSLSINANFLQIVKMKVVKLQIFQVWFRRDFIFSQFISSLTFNYSELFIILEILVK